MRISSVESHDFRAANLIERLGFEPLRRDIYGIKFTGTVETDTLTLTQNKRQDCTYIETLAKSMSEALGEKISPAQLEPVMGKEELTAAIHELKAENYQGYIEKLDENKKPFKTFLGNVQDGTFRADLHSHSHFSDGNAKIPELLDEAASYGDKLQAKTGKKFIFALTDHDGVDGVKEALQLIARDPEKYRNLRFVPGVELSYIHECAPGRHNNNPTECSELLVHCIDPYSKGLNAFIDNVRANRGKMVDNMLADLSLNFSDVEFSRNELRSRDTFYKGPDKTFAMNLHWDVFNYARKKMPDSATELRSVCQKHFPKVEGNKITTLSGSIFEELIDMLLGKNDILVGFAHPAFSAKYFEDPQKVFQYYIARSNGLIKTAEIYHQAYHIPMQKHAITQEEIDAANELMGKFGLLGVGGHDNHASRLL